MEDRSKEDALNQIRKHRNLLDYQKSWEERRTRSLEESKGQAALNRQQRLSRMSGIDFNNSSNKFNTMTTFKRGIKNQSFIDKLNQLYENTDSFWRKMVEDKDLFIAIRDEYINVYYKGNSLCNLECQGGEIVGKTHYKYLLDPNQDKYVTSVNGILHYDLNFNCFNPYLHNITALKKAANAYSGAEKTMIHESILKNKEARKNIIDLEITFPKQSRSTDRIDYLKVERNPLNFKLYLVFHEVKHFDNKEIRAKNSSTPKVIEQITSYERSIQQFEQEIVDSYKTVANNLKALHLIDSKSNSLINLIENESLFISHQVRLFIGGFDKDQQDGKVWSVHREKLNRMLKKDMLGEKRLILKGGK